MRSKTAVKVEVVQKATEKAYRRFGEGYIVGRFLSPIPLYRAMDGEELKKVLDTGQITGGEYSVPFESQWGAQWTASKGEAIQFGIHQAGKRLGHEIFIAETNGNGKVFGHISTRAEDWDFEGPQDMPKSFCNTGLGCSIQTRVQDVKNWYQLKGGKAVKVSLSELKTLAPRLGLKPRSMTLYKGGLIRPSSKIKKALQRASILAQYPSYLDNIRGNSKERRQALQDLGVDRPNRVSNEDIVKELCATCLTDWTTSGKQAEGAANRNRADNINTFAVIVSIETTAAAPDFQVDLEQGAKVSIRSLDMWVRHKRALKNNRDGWVSIGEGSKELRLARRVAARYLSLRV